MLNNRVALLLCVEFRRSVCFFFGVQYMYMKEYRMRCSIVFSFFFFLSEFSDYFLFIFAQAEFHTNIFIFRNVSSVAGARKR